jgi:hypothetical protein
MTFLIALVLKCVWLDAKPYSPEEEEQRRKEQQMLLM